ncbi:DUF2627 domain-containing protein [Paenisporosarcina cavernae]|uniref:DUF2627 domain-containing protein n=1 Tax=Paenisporosarcina cavernae TaxID=2320858 RepID=A0A385YSQ7_9BACL|nr:DUF2627 domain-containing protein [Paenisporosarcina cavernae]AYC29531.1 DUF2627 domain-containing protein [Paenisporosarcina cavernae]
MQRLIAFIILLIPGVMAAGGIKLVRDTLFGKLISPFPFLSVQLLVGTVFIVLGLGFFAGFLLRRDRKNGKIQPKFAQRKK